jgi:hypothetical protein
MRLGSAGFAVGRGHILDQLRLDPESIFAVFLFMPVSWGIVGRTA